jgi:sulfite reductase alpha subunit-like flavoprotein
VPFPGDAWNIFPQNFPEDVQTVLDIMGWNEVADDPVGFKMLRGDPDMNRKFLREQLRPIRNSTLRQLLTYNLDITAIPRQYFFHKLTMYTEDETHNERLHEFASAKYVDEYYDFATRPRRSILEILKDFSGSLNVPFDHAINIFPIIRCRQYSVASGGIKRRVSQEIKEAYSLEYPGDWIQVELLIAVVEYRTILRKVRGIDIHQLKSHSLWHTAF